SRPPHTRVRLSPCPAIPEDRGGRGVMPATAPAQGSGCPSSLAGGTPRFRSMGSRPPLPQKTWDKEKGIAAQEGVKYVGSLWLLAFDSSKLQAQSAPIRGILQGNSPATAKLHNAATRGIASRR